MRVTIAVAALAVAVSATSPTCSDWKQSEYESKAQTDGWTKSDDGDTTTYYDKHGNEITNWDSFQGYDENCLQDDVSNLNLGLF